MSLRIVVQERVFSWFRSCDCLNRIIELVSRCWNDLFSTTEHRRRFFYELGTRELNEGICTVNITQIRYAGFCLREAGVSQNITDEIIHWPDTLNSADHKEPEESSRDGFLNWRIFNVYQRNHVS